MNDQEMKDVIDWYADTAARSRYLEHYPVAQYAVGQPPADYWQKGVRFARSLGFTLKHGWEPRIKSGPGCDGHTVGYAPEDECPGCGDFHEPHVIVIAPDLNPAREYAVLCHELAHAYLHHAPHTYREWAEWLLSQMMSPLPEEKTEDFSDEVTAHLASIAACKANGLRIHKTGLGYLRDRVEGFRRLIGEKERYAALLAGRAIAAAMR